MLRTAVLCLKACDTFEPFKLESSYQEISKMDFLRSCVSLLHKQAEFTLKNSPRLLILIVALISIFVSEGLHV